MSLAQLPVRSQVRVTRLRRGPLTPRLMEMGLIEGVILRVLGRAPLGGPLHLSLGDSQISIRRTEAELIEFAPA